MPNSHASAHASYIQNYISSGIANVIGKARRVEATHKDGRSFPVQLALSQIDSQHGVSFAAVLHKLDEDEANARVTIDAHGVILNVNARCCDMFGYDAQELVGRNINVLMPEHIAKQHSSFLDRYRENGSSSVIGVSNRRLIGQHKNNLTFPIAIHISKEGQGESAVFTGIITDLATEYGMIVINERGEIQTVNTGALTIFGYSSQEDMVGQKVEMLMPEPYASFHNSYLKYVLLTAHSSLPHC